MTVIYNKLFFLIDKDDITEGSGYVVEGSGYDVIEGSAVEPAYNIQPRGSSSDIESDLKQKVFAKWLTLFKDLFR